MVDNVNKGHLTTHFNKGKFEKIFVELVGYRTNNFFTQLETKKEKGRILPFVRGLRFSALLIYAIRDILNGTSLTANWGHLIDENENYCSKECDIIIHKSDRRVINTWNGDGNPPIMDFKFLSQKNAITVISCKSLQKSSDIDGEYCNAMKSYVEKVWLFAECCGPRSAKSIEKKAKDCGYEKFWYLYTYSKNTSPQPNYDGWIHFVKEIIALRENCRIP